MRLIPSYKIALYLLLAGAPVTATLAQQKTAGKAPLRLWFDKPATQWEETLPLGNGRLGMTPDGGVTRETVVLNDITLWSGAPQDANNYEAYKKLPEIKKLLIAGKNDEAQSIIDKDFICTGKGSGGDNYGCFQMLGNLELLYSYNGVTGNQVQPTHYSRSLSLSDAVAHCSYEVNGVTYTREYITSFGDDINIIKLTASKPGQINCTLSLNRPEKATSHVQGQQLWLYGQLENGINGKGMRYQATAQAQLQGGTLTTSNNTLVIKNATSVILFIAAATDYKDSAYQQHLQQTLAAAMRKSYTQQVQTHITRYQKLFNRVSVTLGNSAADSLPTDTRLTRFRQQPNSDNSLPVLFFQFGRYLSIASTRVGLLPPNLQGLWANQVHTPWNGDYHLDVNVQMNHWALETANLSELNLPLANLVADMVPHGEKTAKAYYNANGWVAHVITNLWQFTEPGESASWGISKAGSGWLCNNLWQHYLYSNDKSYLQKIYPVLKGSATFYVSMLTEDPATHWLVTSPASSPENSFYLPDGSGKSASICMGPTIDNQIVRELFNNVIAASQVLGTDAAFRTTLQTTLQRVPPAGQISKDGRLMEWLQDYKETDVNHRHISHLYGLYPAPLITPEATPELAEACKKTLNVRGDDGPSWSIAYKLLFWARLHDGNRAYKLFCEIMKPTLKTDINYGAGGGVYPNLLSAGPPFQIDGNFGACAGIGEMLLQSHAGFIHLLPAIPDNWQAGGSVKGLKAEGNFTVDFSWKDGKITTYTITAPQPRKVKVKVNGAVLEVMAKKA
ncbi:alpha-L-fucosidase 2 [Filimonas lacunae]|uniref:Alpha-L-fucosidase 2 n=1 Tax=Filimonas lacunae TaxID=477680 RepID=A0A1N7P942_9BACT|nr:glycoside hydrolase family 95 protein [Filimonas lacunae]SIT06979.1 alpha-L-fucosidase 2 [Filimonas lacunae]